VLLELSQHAFGRADDVAPAALLEEFDVVVTAHAAIHRPDAVGLAVEGLHLFHDLFDGGAIVAVPA